jgi:signal transduction histidine kinase
MAYITTSVLGALLISVATQYWALQPLLERTRAHNVDAAIENLAVLVTQSLWVYNETGTIDAVNAILRDQFISGVSVNDHTGLFNFSNGDLARSDILNPQMDTLVRTTTANALTVLVPLIVKAEDDAKEDFNIGTLQIQSDNSLIRQQVNELAMITLSVSAMIFVVLQFLFYFLVRQLIAKPLEQFTQHVQTYAADLAPETEAVTQGLHQRSDEIGRLYDVFNAQRKSLIAQNLTLTEYRNHLEQLVSQRTTELSAANVTLVDSLEQLKQAQTELIRSEKMASLGVLVSGIAHEVNTPLGVAITAASHLSEELRITQKRLTNNQLTRSGFETFLTECHETETLLSHNLNRAAVLIQSFKKIAVDQASDEVRFINLHGYLNEIVMSLGPKLKNTGIEVRNRIPDTINLDIPSGALAQIITNLILNSFIHGFKNGTVAGTIKLDAEQQGEQAVAIVYQDNGDGMSAEVLARIYDPFYTTRRSEGGSGLGMNIVYNLVTSKLRGQIETTSQPGEGLKIVMTIKLLNEQPAYQQENAL